MPTSENRRNWMPTALRGARPVVTRNAAKLGLTTLEDRTVPAMLVVTDPTDGGGSGTLRAKIDAAANGDVVTFLPGLTGTITLTGELKIAKSITIQGPGSAILLDANMFRAFDVDDGVTGVASTVAISDFTIKNAVSAANGGAVFNQSETLTLRRINFDTNTADQGGAVAMADGMLTVEDCFFLNNKSNNGGGAIDIAAGTATVSRSRFLRNQDFGAGGGAVFQQAGTLTADGSSFDQNVANAGDGGALLLQGTATVQTSSVTNNKALGNRSGGGVRLDGAAATPVVFRNVTVSGNQATGDGGGVSVKAGAVTVQNSTIAFNKSDSDDSGDGNGGGLSIAAGADVTITSTLVGNNANGAFGVNPDVSGDLNVASAFNLVADRTGVNGKISNGNNNNQVGGASPLPTGLLPLASSGITFVHPLTNASTAKDAGTNPSPAATSDARGGPFLRAGGAAPDVGAYEIQPNVALVVTTAADENDATFNAADLSLREALRYAGEGASDITFAPALAGQTIALTQGVLFVSSSVRVTGPGANQLTIDAGGKDTAVLVTDLALAGTPLLQVAFAGLTVANGASGTGNLTQFGGGIISEETLTLDGVAVTGNKSSVSGGGVLSFGGNLTVRNSTVSGNSAADVGGGIAATGANVTLVNSTVTGNTAKADGGGVYFSFAGNLVIKSSTVAGNTADSDNAGGGKGGGVRVASGTAEFVSSILGDNVAGTSGSEPDVSGTAKVNFSLIENAAGFAAAAGTGAASNKTGDAKLAAALADNGGGTKTLLPAAGSPVIDAGSSDASLTTDQRGAGFARVVGTAADIGAVEFNPNTPPTITSIADAATTAGTAKAVTFTVGDDITPAGSLVVTAASDNPTLVPNTAAALAVTGTGSNRTLTVTPAAGQTGTATITVTVADAAGATTTEMFVLTVTPAGTNVAPTLTPTPIANPAAVTPGTPVTVSFVAADDATPAASLALAYASSNTALVPNGTAGVFGGTGGNKTLTITPAAGQTGTAVITVTATDAGGLSATDTFTVTVAATATGTPVLVGYPQFAAGADVGGSTATLYDPDQSVRFTVTPFPGFTGGVRTAAGDFNADGVADLVVGTGPGAATRVRVLDGKSQGELFSVSPFEAAFTGGVYVAAGDLNGDGVADLVITPDEGGGPRADVYSGAGFGKTASFFGIDDPNFRGGARAAVGDVNGDGTGDLLVVAGFGGGPRVAGFDGRSLSSTPTRVFADFFMFEQTLRNGVFITAGDLNGDGKADVIAGGGPGGGPRVFALSGAGLIAGQQTQLANFFAGDVNSRGGVRVGVKNLDRDAKADLVVGSGAGAGSRVTGYLGATTPASGTPPVAFDFASISGFNGVFVG